MAALPSGTVTFLFSDIEGSTRLLHDLGATGYAAALTEHRRTLREAFGRHGGVEVDTQGDAFFVAFPTAPGALAAAAEAQEALASGPVAVRMGLHTGTPLLADEGYVGVDVHRAARIAAAAHGGQIVVSAATRSLVDDASLWDLGEHRLKDLAAAERLWQLGNEEFPQLRTLYHTNLPVPATPFLGREQELREVVALLTREDVRLLTLSGPGGTGKTRLALQAAAEVAEEFPDGLAWVSLSPIRDAALLLSAVAQALEVKEQPGRELADTLVAHLAGRRQLLLLDNVEHLLPRAAADVGCLRDAAGVTLLVTSRERLQLQGEQVWPVPPLEVDDGVNLFVTRALALEPVFKASPAVLELCARLDNLPLALELAAARTPLFSPEQLLDRLGERLDLLKAGREADPRQQTLRATIAWSHDLLDRDEQQLFRRLAVFVDGCTYEAAAKVCEADPDTLQSLLDKSLLRRRDTDFGPRYWMLETIREFAAERLHESGEAEDRSVTHAEYFLWLAEETEPALHGPGQLACLGRLEGEHDNLRAALGASEPKRRLRLAAALSWFWHLRSYFSEGLGWLEQALGESLAPTMDRASALSGAGRLSFYFGDREAACRLLEESAGLMQELGDQRGLAQALTYAGISAGNSGDASAARMDGERAVATSRASGDEWTRALALWGLGSNYLLGRCGPPDPEAAAPLLEESVALFRKTGDKWGLAAPLFYLGRIARGSGDLDAAWHLLSESAALLREVGEKFRLNLALQGLGDIARSQGDEPAAHAFYAEALEACREMNQTEAIADAQLKLALTAIDRGEAQEARSLLRESLDGYRACRSIGGILWVLEVFSLLASREGHRQRAAILLGASEGRETGGGIQLDPAEREQLEADLLDQLGPELFETARARGVAMRPEEAVEYALPEDAT